ncbi:MAG: helix-turn-helix domain-containing protein [Defluviitaleaceae bacterium]|nr:helix-turn-helix domain-containing protein [Defluviitaleaceae bacterium]
MTFGEKLRNARNALNLSQIELAERAGITERSIYSYEQTGALPRTPVLKKLAEELNVTVTYFLDENESDRQKNIDQELFIANVRNEHGSRGAREASEVLTRASALFAGGELEDDAKEIFFQSLMEVYLESKAEAREKFSSKRVVSRKK